MKNGFFRTRHFAQASEAGSVELFSEERDSGEEVEESSYQVAAKRRIDRLEKEEFIRKCKVRLKEYMGGATGCIIPSIRLSDVEICPQLSVVISMNGTIGAM